jgi:cytochrome o ubiquinol oxidase operon protein cyoD
MAHSHNAHDGHHHGHDHGHDDHAHGSFKSYMTGFVLAVILTVIPFGIVMGGGFDSRALTIAVVVLCAVAQVLVHMIYFLHMTSSAEEGWTMLSTVFTVVIVVIMLAGSLWVMFHMNTNMMPQMSHELQVMP